MNASAIGSMHKYRVELTTVSDIRDFVNIASKCKGTVLLKCSDAFCINAKSLLGVLVAKRLKWNSLCLFADEDVYFEFRKYIID